GALPYWEQRLTEQGVTGLKHSELFGEKRLAFDGPDGDGFVLVETRDDERAPWTGGGVRSDEAIRGFHSVSMRLQDGGATAELLKFMNYEEIDRAGGIRRFAVRGDGNGADLIDVETLPVLDRARQ